VLRQPHGIVLVTGPTGSGKTTTLYASLAVLNTADRKILTIEDPIEYRLAGINQTQVSAQIGLNFAAALRSFLRQDPDVMMVGEIRDLETAQVAVQAALTGHTILSTLHTNSAAAAVTRLLDMGVEPFLITSTLNAVLAQRLVRRLCQKCREPFAPTPEMLAALYADHPFGRIETLYRPVGCEACGGDGVEPGTEPVTCRRCEGSGRLHQVSRSLFGEFVRAQTCPECRGRGQIVEHPCEGCRGAGRVSETKTLDVDVPAGIHDGQRIRVSGAGHAGALGGQAGDVYVLVRVNPDTRFVREGNDIYSQVDLTIVEAALGATMTVETLDGATELELPAGVQPGEVRVLRGKGMPVLQGFGRGDQRVLVNVSVPRRVSDEQRRLLEEFEAASDEHTYRHDEGFFEKLKSAFR